MRDVSETVLKLLADRSAGVRYSAAECVGVLYEGESCQAPWLYPLLSDRNMLARIEAIESIVQITDKSALPLIADLLDDREALVRSYSAWGIAILGGNGYVPALRRALALEKDEVAERGFRQALFDLGDSEQFPLILTFLRSKTYQVRCACANGIADADLTSAQLQLAREAIAYSEQHALFRADKTTMERVLRELRDRT